MTTTISKQIDLTNIEAILFDFDGTLANTLPGIVATATRVLAAHGFTPEQMGDVSRLVGPPFPQAFSEVYGVDEAEAIRLMEDYHAIYEKLGLESHPLYPGMREVLEALAAKGMRLAVASSKRQFMVEQALADNQVESLFEVICGKGPDGDGQKAHVIGRACDMLGTTAATTLMVGDRFYDVQGASELGMACVAVNFGTTSRAELEEAGAAIIVDSPSELLDVLTSSADEQASGDAQLAGAYEAKVKTPMGPQTLRFTFAVQGNQLTGSMALLGREAPIIEGQLTSSGFSYACEVGVLGKTMRAEVNGHREQDQIVGSIAAPLGTFSFTGVRVS